MGFITIRSKDIVKKIDRSDVVIVYLKKEHWVCTKDKPKFHKNGTVTYKLATKE